LHPEERFAAERESKVRGKIIGDGVRVQKVERWIEREI
jgi:hypothetical protein